MNFTRTNNARTYQGQNIPNGSGCRKARNREFIMKWARRYSAKEGAALAGMTPKGFQKVQLGENSMSFDTWTSLLENDVELAAAYAAHVGLITERDATKAAALTNLIKAHTGET